MLLPTVNELLLKHQSQFQAWSATHIEQSWSAAIVYDIMAVTVTNGEMVYLIMFRGLMTLYTTISSNSTPQAN